MLSQPCQTIAARLPHLQLVILFSAALTAVRQLFVLLYGGIAGQIYRPTAVPKQSPAVGYPCDYIYKLKEPLSAPGCLLFSSRLLPPQSPSHYGRLTVVLDLDETMVCTYKADQVPQGILGPAIQQSVVPLKLPYGNNPAVPCDVLVFLRPDIQQFLQQLSSFAEVVLFTAGIAAYAKPLAALLDPDQRHFSGILCRDATVKTIWRHNVKDLSLLGRDLARTVIVDNNPCSFLLQPANGVPCQPFFGDGGDQQLLGVILPLLHSLQYVADVRPFLMSRFQMTAWFNSKGLEVPEHFNFFGETR